MAQFGLEGLRVSDPRLQRPARLGAAMSNPKQRDKAADLLEQRLRRLIRAVEIAPVEDENELFHALRIGVYRAAEEIVGEKAQHAAVWLCSRDAIRQFPHERSCRFQQHGQTLGNLLPRGRIRDYRAASPSSAQIFNNAAFDPA